MVGWAAIFLILGVRDGRRSVVMTPSGTLKWAHRCFDYFVAHLVDWSYGQAPAAIAFQSDVESGEISRQSTIGHGCETINL